MSDQAVRVLLVDDEPSIVRVLKSSLAAAGYDVATAATGDAALTAIALERPEAVLLDLGLPDIDGKEIITAIRAWSDTPIIVISARHDESEKIAALDCGADDFVNKPFHMGELQARLRAALRHRVRKGLAEAAFHSGALRIDFHARTVMLGDQEVRLTRKEYDLLRVLAQHAGQVVTHKQLLAAGWGSSVTDTQFVRVYVGQIRQKIEEDPSNPRLILTEPGIGYRLVEM